MSVLREGYLPVVPVWDVLLIKNLTTKVVVNDAIGRVIERRVEKGQKHVLGLLLKEKANIETYIPTDFHKIGKVLEITFIERVGNKYKISVRADERAEVKSMDTINGELTAHYELLPDIHDLNKHDEHDMLKYIKDIIGDISQNFKGADEYFEIIRNFHNLNDLMVYIAPYMRINQAEKQSLVEIRSDKDRGLKFMDYLISQEESIKLQIEMAQRFTDKANKSYREAYLREQLKTIQDELNEGKGKRASTAKDYQKEIENSDMPEEVKNVALAELDKLEMSGGNNPESHVIRNYLDLLIALPWKNNDKEEIDIEFARKTLDEEHYGLEKIKERIIQHLAVMKRKKEKKGTILLLVGPPGTGKTSLGKSIASALKREYVRISLGGVRDEAEIRGHRRTYVGALPGRIIQGMKKAKVINPVFVLDEVDKLMRGFNGDPASALLEVLDPEQNNSFADHYLEVPYDLSEVFFLATANDLGSIPRPLLDRMEVIQLSSYTNKEKLHIGENHLIKKVLEEHGLTSDDLIITNEVLEEIINKYTMEAGVRGLKRRIETLARVATEKIVSKKVETPFEIKPEMLEEFLGKKVARHDKAGNDNPAGVSTGMAWTPIGGEILFIETASMPGNGQLILTGQLGDVMKESAKISMSLIRSRLSGYIKEFNFKENDIHIHVPSGSVPKDGPSAGVALLSALASLALNKKIDPKLSMTGEITLRGAVLPVGGIKEKVMAAHRSGIKKVILPADNMVDLKDVPEEVKNQLEFRSVETIEEVFREVLELDMRTPFELKDVNFSRELPAFGQ